MSDVLDDAQRTAGPLLERIDSLRGQLRASECKVADVVARDPGAVIAGRMADVARMAGVSEPSVLRFCRAIGYESFNAFKIRLAQDVAVREGGGVSLSQIDLSRDDTVGSAVSKVFAAAIDCLARVRDALDVTTVERAALAIARARRVEIWGYGASGVVAEDAAHKLFRLVPGAIARSDPHMQIMAASALGADDAVIAISHTGRTRELVEAVTRARQTDATVIALTCPGSVLARLAHIPVAVDVREDTDVYTPMVSRLAHLTVIDAIAVGVALLLPPSTAGRLGQMKDALKSKRVLEIETDD